MGVNDAVDCIFVCIISCVIISMSFIYNANQFSSALEGLTILFAILITIFVCYAVVQFELISKCHGKYHGKCQGKKKKRWK